MINNGFDITDEWEDQLDKHSRIKLKFPIKVIEPDLIEMDVSFHEPEIKEPEMKKSTKDQQKMKVVDLQNKNKKRKPKLF
jgi:hypothetical protein